ncbi:ornithine carbamyltransferase [Syntrophotalea carbinolica DSM 2380]|uniref:Ornithine carbamoyltransferase n=1 Tax=Syntrophotalea carbinolica (strain DSM 2380 / NBRC 103641 / GraBd1) TaxID=338963 RepID=OTC_SYNC1|nr:ornithine carbamoyltransferase [Syntrophotalea carbinolica]Q3A1V3.1 RecName: Full=Ornithine carbamoyltransferase; Short=OTCase [Syntrophotalea carbinolica DSM 2380]ABA89654.1 ornithine carbamyltransferase [Syntrophotalea carbinolica DSM 2380]
MKKDFLCLTDWSLEELENLFTLAADLKAKQKAGEQHHLLKGKTLGMLFEKSSTRTRVSFEVGMYQLGGHALFLSSGSTQMGRGEPIKDTGRVMSRYVDGIMIRTFSQEGVEELAQWSTIPIINGLTDMYHPCQVMADLLTVIEHKKNYRDLTYCWIGDGNNMANSWINAAAMFGFELRVATPKGYEPHALVVERAKKLGARVTYLNDPLEAARGAHVLNTDVWASMGQEEEQAKRAAAFAGFQINAETIAAADPACILLHCLPAHRDEEITDEAIESSHAVVFDEAENRLHIQKAIMATLMA